MKTLISLGLAAIVGAAAFKAFQSRGITGKPASAPGTIFAGPFQSLPPGGGVLLATGLEQSHPTTFGTS